MSATRVLLLGGTSEIGLAIVRRLAEDGPVRAILAGRDEAKLEAALGEARIDGELVVIDADDLDSHPAALDAAFARLGGMDTVVLAVGSLGGQAGLDAPRDESLGVMRLNFLGSGSLMLAALERLRAQRSGALVVLSSAAVERPRASNAVYGAAKRGLDDLAQGLADSLAGTGVRVLVVRPGFVYTRMTAGLDPAPMATTPDAVAEAVAAGLAGGAHTIWVPGRLHWVFTVLRHLPRSLYRRLPM